jgi:hypothetical protein
MNQLTFLFMLLVIFTTSKAQLDIGTHIILGYGAGSTGISNAYTAPYNAGNNAMPPSEYLNDRFHHSSWMFKVSRWDENVYVDTDLSIFSALVPGTIDLFTPQYF